MDYHDAYANLMSIVSEQDAHTLSRLQRLNNLESPLICPHCGCPLSLDLHGRTFCRGCQKNIKRKFGQKKFK